MFLLPKTNSIKSWEDGFSFIRKMVEKYLENGKYANILKGLQAVGIGKISTQTYLISLFILIGG